MSITLERPTVRALNRRSFRESLESLNGLYTRPATPRGPDAPPAPDPQPSPPPQPDPALQRAQAQAEMSAALREMEATASWTYSASFSPHTIADRERYYVARERYDTAARQLAGFSPTYR